MAYDEFLADRIRNSLKGFSAPFEEKKMFGGICFMVDDKMCAGIVNNDFMGRIDPEFYEQALLEKGCREMDFSHRPMKGFVFVSPEGVDSDSNLDKWVKRCLDYNPKAKPGKKK